MVNYLTLRYPALASRGFRHYWLASFASVGATQLITLGQGWLIFELSGSAVALGLLGAAAAAPNIALTLLGGVIADRFDKRRIMIFTSATTTLLLVILAWLDYSGQVAVWHVLTIAALVSVVTGLDWPARVSFYPLLVERQAFMSAVALNSFIWQVTRMAMSAAGGLLIAVAGNTWVLFALGAAGFFTMFLVILNLQVSTPAAAAQSPLEALLEGLRFIWQTTLFRYLLMLTFTGMFFAQSYVQIMPVFADLLGSDEKGFGYLLSAGGVGSVAGTLLIGSIHRFQRLGVVMLLSSAASALMLFGFALAARSGSFGLALTTAFMAATCASVFMISSMTILQLEVPDQLRGRVMGIHTIGFSLIPLGGLFIGWLAERLGADVAVMAGNSIYLLIIVMMWFGITEIRRLDGQALENKQAEAG